MFGDPEIIQMGTERISAGESATLHRFRWDDSNSGVITKSVIDTWVASL